MALSFFISCASSVRISPITCQTHALWNSPISSGVEVPFSVSKRFFTSSFFGGETVIKPEQILENADIDCQKVTSFSIEVEDDFLSIIGGLVLLPSVNISLVGKYEDQEIMQEDPEFF